MKRILGSLFAIAAFGLITFSSCEREYNTRICESPANVQCFFDSSAVNVRIINNTGYDICDVEVLYDLDSGDVVTYGSMEQYSTSCYTSFPTAKKYPYVTFTLGTGNYAIHDSLKVANKPYNLEKIEDPGFYTFFIYFLGDIEDEKCQTVVFRDF